jgi:ABC-type antimicrobial peptide transport system permease subunit
MRNLSRIAAQRSEILRMVLQRGISAALGGMLLGTVTALATARLAPSRLYGISSTDPITYSGMLLIFALVSAFACLKPCLRAARLDPLVALRDE